MMAGARARTGLVALFGAAFVVAAAANLPVLPDEAYYWTWSRALTPAYLDHPPAIAWTLAFVTRLFGDGPLGLRAPALLALVLTAALVGATAERAGGRRTLALLLFLGAPLSLVFIPATPDALLGASTALTAWALIRALEGEASPERRIPARWAFLAAFVLVAAVLIKHYAAVVALGVVLGLLRTAGGRRLLGSAGFVLGALAGLAAASPWLSAELDAGAQSSVAFQLGRVLSAEPRGLLAAPVMLGALLLAIGPLTVVAMGREVVRSLRRPSAAFEPALAGGAAALLLACWAAVWCGSGEANWALPALILLLPLVARPAGPRTARALAVGAGVTLALDLVLLLHAVRPILPLAPAADPLARGEGYAQLARDAQAFASAIGANRIVTRRYQAASELRYHLRDALPVLELGTAGGRPSQYDRWPRPSLCPGDLFLWIASNAAELTELPVEPAPYPTRHGTAGGRPVEIIPLLAKGAFDPDHRCPGGAVAGRP
jgi:4-amino-4-deoxy-L-arabinose transferase-like glycosyltransferase